MTAFDKNYSSLPQGNRPSNGMIIHIGKANLPLIHVTPLLSSVSAYDYQNSLSPSADR